MILVDSDVLIDFFRGYPPAVSWLTQLSEPPALPGLAIMEVFLGCRNRTELNRVKKQLENFRVFWPTDRDSERALHSFSELFLSHGVGFLDALIAETAIGLGATLFGFNLKHFKYFKDLNFKRPYSRWLGSENKKN